MAGGPNRAEGLTAFGAAGTAFLETDQSIHPDDSFGRLGPRGSRSFYSLLPGPYSLPFHSSRSACIGSIDAARRAGSNAAVNPIAGKARATTMYVHASSGFTW
jgi:hypothetical protein